MARVTVEKALKNIPNRFLLVHATTRRARQLMKGSSPLVKGYRNREIVMALRELDAGKVSIAKKPKDVKGSIEDKIETIELKPNNLEKEGMILPTEESLLEEGISVVQDLDGMAEEETSKLSGSKQEVSPGPKVEEED